MQHKIEKGSLLLTLKPELALGSHNTFSDWLIFLTERNIVPHQGLEHIEEPLLE